MNDNQFWVGFRDNFKSLSAFVKKVIFTIFLGSIFSWLTVDEFTPFLLSGKTFSGRSEWIQVELVVILAMLYAALFIGLSYILPPSLFSRLNVVSPVQKKFQVGRDQKITIIIGIIITGFLLSVLFHVYQGSILGKPYPYSTFLFKPTDQFNDFRVARFAADLNPYFNPAVPGGQFPVVIVFDYLVTLIPMNTALLIYLVLISASFAYLTNIILWGKKIPLFNNLSAILPIVFLTYPFLFTIDRGNLESLLFIFLLLFLYYFLQEKHELSTIFLAISIAMKGFPVVLVLLFFIKKKYAEMLFSILLAILLTLGSLALFKGGLAANLNFLLQGQIFGAQSHFYGSANIVQRGVTLFTFFKIIFIESGWLARIDMSQFLSAYIKLAILSFIPLAAYIVFVEKILWKQVALLVFSMLLLPHVSADYKLMHLYLPMFLFIISDDYSDLDWFYLLVFGLLMIPKDYAYFPHTFSDAGAADISISVMINIVLMILMSIFIVVSGLKNITLKDVLVSFAKPKHDTQ